MYAKKINQLVN